MKTLSEITASNRAAWDASAPAHEETDMWKEMLKQAASPGFSVLDETLSEAVRSVAPRGKRVVQVGCNNGRDLLSLGAFGAVPVLGIDQSAAFLDQARKLALAAGSECDFLCADVYDLPADTPTGFDLGLITIGVLNWMPDLPRFFEVVAGLLAPQARLVIYETHPVLEMFDPEADDPFRPARSYFDKSPVIFEEAITYDGSEGGEAPASYWFTHTLGAVVTACASAGFVIERLTEYPHSNREVDYDIYQGRDPQIPMCFTLVARKRG
ncbi:MAG: SAM-dependent methyltransferase [Confluentimicrobium sp.]|jgi:SAM-dependent methyltransferase|uniref:class I SAM-dependent methyltransferase n=1 Tax=Actibacterium sp. TaxID=1872125 RepID=UPI000C51974F|nr:class I SAM-dependent methyltransferase [Actibacterium sp.]MBC55420.1 SAM-dependent methyltransferase [Actibacterium sp.]